MSCTIRETYSIIVRVLHTFMAYKSCNMGMALRMMNRPEKDKILVLKDGCQQL